MYSDSPENSTARVTDPVSFVIKISNLHFSYPGKRQPTVLNIPAWQVARGDRVFLKGPSGSGKSTLLNLLAGILVANQGRIEILGQDIAALSAHKRDRFRAAHIGIVFQQFNLIPYLSVLDNIRLAAHFGKKHITGLDLMAKQLFEALGLDHTLITKKASNLSVGQQQRVAIARALINAPEILIVDEPTSALDSDIRDAFIKILMAIGQIQGNTLLFVSHDTALTPHFHHVVNLAEINLAGGNQYVS
ncbi:ABC transporter ATP-binding protein [Nitrosomonas sp. Nm34]|uniref:ABC transporter ATP-binding protein n=1 Tax=Nitrosomonas sp. Nm34 TaxID=1881055 RepID=UPI0008E79BC8|nr:ABC transporter ATP-binding protein [Nitrosomonas sp. Nm34]SFI83044.1 putative ABC transport system ATP-binding protein [Nitrosomonas sp. Nm34]